MNKPTTSLSSTTASPHAKAAAEAVLDDFMTSFNARDARGWAETLHYPHVRLADDTVSIWQSAEEYAQTNDIEKLQASGWNHTRWDRKQLVQSGTDKLHFLVSFTRYDVANQPLSSHEALYVLTRRQERWGIQARSSYAGIAVPGAAF